MKNPQAWMRRPKFKARTMDGVERCTVRAEARIDADTFDALNRAFTADDVFKDRQAALSYCLRLGIEQYLQNNGPADDESIP